MWDASGNGEGLVNFRIAIMGGRVLDPEARDGFVREVAHDTGVDEAKLFARLAESQPWLVDVGEPDAAETLRTRWEARHSVHLTIFSLRAPLPAEPTPAGPWAEPTVVQDSELQASLANAPPRPPADPPLPTPAPPPPPPPPQGDPFALPVAGLAAPDPFATPGPPPMSPVPPAPPLPPPPSAPVAAPPGVAPPIVAPPPGGAPPVSAPHGPRPAGGAVRPPPTMLRQGRVLDMRLEAPPKRTSRLLLVLALLGGYVAWQNWRDWRNERTVGELVGTEGPHCSVGRGSFRLGPVENMHRVEMSDETGGCLNDLVRNPMGCAPPLLLNGARTLFLGDELGVDLTLALPPGEESPLEVGTYELRESSPDRVGGSSNRPRCGEWTGRMTINSLTWQERPRATRHARWEVRDLSVQWELTCTSQGSPVNFAGCYSYRAADAEP